VDPDSFTSVDPYREAIKWRKIYILIYFFHFYNYSERYEIVHGGTIFDLIYIFKTKTKFVLSSVVDSDWAKMMEPDRIKCNLSFMNLIASNY
jgi:hypothetical protein